MENTETNETVSIPSDVQAIADLGADATSFKIETIKNSAGLAGVPDEVPALFMKGRVPYATAARSFFEAFRTRPERKKGQAAVETVESFVELVNRHETDDSVIFVKTVDCDTPTMTAVINYHPYADEDEEGNASAAFCDHRIVYKFPISDEWKIWSGRSDVPLLQEDLANFIEDRIADLADPTKDEIDDAANRFFTTIATPAKMMELSRGLQVNVESKVRDNFKLQSGEASLIFEEVHKDAAGQNINVPGLFYLSIPAFVGGEKKRIPVRLRYRLKDGSVIWRFQLYRPELIIHDAIEKAVQYAENSTDLPVFYGEPEGAE